MNKVLEPYFVKTIRVFISDLRIYDNQSSHLEKLEKIFECYDKSEITLSAENSKFNFCQDV